MTRCGISQSLAEMVEERGWIPVGVVQPVPQSVETSGLQVACNKRGFPGARWAPDPGERSLALVKAPEEPRPGQGLWHARSRCLDRGHLGKPPRNIGIS